MVLLFQRDYQKYNKSEKIKKMRLCFWKNL